MSENQGEGEKEYTQAQRIKSGLLAVSPNLKAYASFLEDDKGDIEPFKRIGTFLCLSGFPIDHQHDQESE